MTASHQYIQVVKDVVYGLVYNDVAGPIGW